VRGLGLPDSLFADWTVANLLQDGSVADGRYAYANATFHAAVTGTASTETPFLGEAPQYAVNYVDLPPGAVTVVQPAVEELEESGAEYLLVLRHDPHSQTGTLSTSIQTCMALARCLDSTTDDHRAYAPGSYTVRVAMLGTNFGVVVDKTIAFDRGSAGPGGVADPQYAVASGGALGVLNTIVGENSPADCEGGKFTLTADRGHNLDSDSSCFTGATDRHANPLLAPPANNGGGVLTDALLKGSPALNAGANKGCPKTDARGVKRPQGPRCDIGAYEALGGKGVASDTATAGPVAPSALRTLRAYAARHSAASWFTCAKQAGCRQASLAWLQKLLGLAS